MWASVQTVDALHALLMSFRITIAYFAALVCRAVVNQNDFKFLMTLT